MKLFQTGGKTFISWMTNIAPGCAAVVGTDEYDYCPLIGEERIERFAQKQVVMLMRYLVLPFLAAFMLGNPMFHVGSVPA